MGCFGSADFLEFRSLEFESTRVPEANVRKNPLSFCTCAGIFGDLMSRLALTIFALVCAGIAPVFAQVSAPAATPATPKPNPNALKWSTESLEVNATPGQETAPFIFHVTNASETPVVFNALRTSCGCTVAQLPTTPYTLAPGASFPINASMDLRGKQGTIAKSVTVDTSVGIKQLLVKANIPAATTAATGHDGHNHGGANAPTMNDRTKNIQTALADRQAVFKGDCASCHVDKGKGKFGAELYAASCGICHDAEHRAAMVPDLKVPKTKRDVAFWQKWIMEGKPGTMMPAFAQAYGGPLTQEQIDSLTVYLYNHFPKEPPATATSASATPVVTPQVLKAN